MTLERTVRAVLDVGIYRDEWNGNLVSDRPKIVDGRIYRGKVSLRTLLRDAGYPWNDRVAAAARKVVSKLGS